MFTDECNFLKYAIHKGWLTSDTAHIIYDMLVFDRIHLACHYCKRALLTTNDVDIMKIADFVLVEAILSVDNQLLIYAVIDGVSTPYILEQCVPIGTSLSITSHGPTEITEPYDQFLLECTGVTYARVAHTYSQAERYFADMQTGCYYCFPCWKMRSRMRKALHRLRQ